MKNKKSVLSFLKRDSVKSLSASLLSVFVGISAGALIIIIVAVFNEEISFKDATDGIKLIFFGVFSKGRGLTGELVFGFSKMNAGNMLFRAMPVIMTGLSVAFAFKAGLFNIGAPGQYLIGTAGTLITALSIPSEVIPPLIIWILAFLVGMLSGALWGLIPGIFRAYFGISEVLSSIMTNWISSNLVTWIFESSPLRHSAETGKTGYIMKTSVNSVMTPKLGLDRIFEGSQINPGIIIACFFAFLVYVVISKTTFGFELKALGLNRNAAEYAGIKTKRLIMKTLAIAGSLSGGGAALYYLSGNTEFFWATYQSLPKEGFNGIPVALLALSNPIGVIFSSLFMSALNISGQQLKTFTPLDGNITDIVSAVIVYLSAFSLLMKSFIQGRKSHKKKASSFPFNLTKRETQTEERSAEE